MYDTWLNMTRLIHSGLDVTPIITHRYPIDEYEEAFKVGLSGECGKIILEWE
jgi:threonine 3-dehydrogenase